MKIFLLLVIGAFSYVSYYYYQALRYPSWYHPFKQDALACVSSDVAQKKFDPALSLVQVHHISTPQGLLRAWHVKALKNRSGNGIILVHGGGADHNLFNIQAHFFSQKGWDSLMVDLPNHGCSYNNEEGLQFGVEEGRDFEKFYDLAQKLFKVKAIMGTSLGSTVAARYSFNTGKPEKLILENPMLNLKRIVTDQKAYSLPDFIRPLIEKEMLFLNRRLLLPEITTIKPRSNQKILVLYGSRDKLTPGDIQGPEIQAAWKDQAEIQTIEGASHSQLIQHAPGQVEKILEEFLIK